MHKRDKQWFAISHKAVVNSKNLFNMYFLRNESFAFPKNTQHDNKVEEGKCFFYNYCSVFLWCPLIRSEEIIEEIKIWLKPGNFTSWGINCNKGDCTWRKTNVTPWGLEVDFYKKQVAWSSRSWYLMCPMVYGFDNSKLVEEVVYDTTYQPLTMQPSDSSPHSLTPIQTMTHVTLTTLMWTQGLNYLTRGQMSGTSQQSVGTEEAFLMRGDTSSKSSHFCKELRDIIQ